MYLDLKSNLKKINIIDYLLIILVSLHLFFWDIKLFANYGFRELIILSSFIIFYKLYKNNFLFFKKEKKIIINISIILFLLLLHLIINAYIDKTFLFKNSILGFFGISFLFIFVLYFYDFIKNNLEKIIIFFIITYFCSLIFSDFGATTEWEKTFLGRCAFAYKISNNLIFQENSHLGMIFPACLAFLLSASKNIKMRLLYSIIFILLLIFQTSITLTVGLIIFSAVILIFDKSKIIYPAIILLFMASIFYYGSIYPQERGNNCAERISQTNVAVVENLRLNIEKSEIYNHTNEKIRIPNEKIFKEILNKKDKTVFKNYLSKEKSFEDLPTQAYKNYFNLSTAVLLNSLNISLDTLKNRPLGWGLNRYETAFDYYMFNLIIIPPWYHEVYTLNYNDGSSNFTKSFTEFGFLTFIFLIPLFYFIFSKRVKNKEKIFFLTLIITQILRGAGYFNGGFAFSIIFIIITFLKKYDEH